MSDFENLWKELQYRVKPGAVVPNWTLAGRYSRENMTITDIDDNYIKFEAPNAKNPQNVPKEDFREVWHVWDDYKAQKIKRHELRDMTRFSKYIISLLHWYEKEGKQ